MHEPLTHALLCQAFTAPTHTPSQTEPPTPTHHDPSSTQPSFVPLRSAHDWTQPSSDPLTTRRSQAPIHSDPLTIQALRSRRKSLRSTPIRSRSKLDALDEHHSDPSSDPLTIQALIHSTPETKQAPIHSKRIPKIAPIRSDPLRSKLRFSRRSR